MQKLNKAILACFAALGLSGCMLTESPSPLVGTVEQWNNLSPAKVESTDNIGEHQSVIVFYRNNEVKGGAVNLFLNDHYLSSLLPNSFTSHVMCSTNRLNVKMTYSQNADFKSSARSWNVENLSNNRITYFKVEQTKNGELNLNMLPEEQAKSEVGNLAKSNQTLSRVPTQNCNYN